VGSENAILILSILCVGLNMFVKLFIKSKLYCDIKNRTGVAVEVVPVDQGISVCQQGNCWAGLMRSWYCYWSNCGARVQGCVKPWRRVMLRLRHRFVFLTGVHQVGSFVVVVGSIKLWLVIVLIIVRCSICICIQQMYLVGSKFFYTFYPYPNHS
jgi:hypothetical protein